jgi:hypothetical protein
VSVRPIMDPPDLRPTNRRLLDDGSLAMIIRNREATGVGYVFLPLLT